MKQKENITIDDLAKMIKEGFDETDKKFEQIRKELKGLGDSLQGAEGKLLSAIKGEREKRTAFNVKMIEILNRNGLLIENESSYLELLT